MGKDYYFEFGEEEEKITLPSEKNRRKRVRRNGPESPNSKKLKWGMIIIGIILIYLFYNSIILFFLDLLKSNPTIYSYYLYMESEIASNTLKGLFFVATLGSLFFLVLPSEAVFIYYLSSTQYYFLLVLSITILGSLIGLTFNYFFGRLIGERAIRFIFKKNFENYQNKINKYGGYVLFFGNILPGPIEVLAVFYGGFKFNYVRFFYLSFMGRMIKYSLLFLAYFFFWDQIVFYYDSILQNILVLKDLYTI